MFKPGHIVVWGCNHIITHETSHSIGRDIRVALSCSCIFRQNDCRTGNSDLDLEFTVPQYTCSSKNLVSVRYMFWEPRIFEGRGTLLPNRPIREGKYGIRLGSYANTE